MGADISDIEAYLKLTNSTVVKVGNLGYLVCDDVTGYKALIANSLDILIEKQLIKADEQSSDKDILIDFDVVDDIVVKYTSPIDGSSVPENTVVELYRLSKIGNPKLVKVKVQQAKYLSNIHPLKLDNEVVAYLIQYRVHKRRSYGDFNFNVLYDRDFEIVGDAKEKFNNAYTAELRDIKSNGWSSYDEDEEIDVACGQLKISGDLQKMKIYDSTNKRIKFVIERKNNKVSIKCRNVKSEGDVE